MLAPDLADWLRGEVAFLPQTCLEEQVLRPRAQRSAQPLGDGKAESHVRWFNEPAWHASIEELPQGPFGDAAAARRGKGQNATPTRRRGDQAWERESPATHPSLPIHLRENVVWRDIESRMVRPEVSRQRGSVMGFVGLGRVEADREGADWYCGLLRHERDDR